MDGLLVYAFGALGLAVAAVLVLRVLVVLTGKRKSQPAGRVVGIVGKMGSGKSYLAVRLARDRLRAGVDVYSNFLIQPPAGWKGNAHAFRGWDEFASIRDAVVIIDEAHLLAPSYAHARFPQTARTALAFARKYGLDVYWVSQNEDRVNRTLRDLTNDIAVCEKRGRRFRVTWYSAEDVRKKGEHMFRETHRFDPEIANLYDTAEIIQLDEHLEKRGRGRAS